MEEAEEKNELEADTKSKLLFVAQRFPSVLIQMYPFLAMTMMLV